MIVEKIKGFLKKYPFLYYFLRLLRYYYYSILPQEVLIKKLWNNLVSYPLNLENPRTFNEKIQWLKIYYRNPLVKVCSNKINVRTYVSKHVKENILIRLYGTYNSFDEIDFDNLPNSFVIKCSHDSGSTKIVRNKSNLNIKDLRTHFNFCMKINYYHMSKEWGYDKIERKILVEDLLSNKNNEDIKDYKVFCFWGEPMLIQVDIDRHSNHKRNIYDIDWNYIDLSILYPQDKSRIETKPKLLEKMLNYSKILSSPFPHVRVDWYINEENLYFGEMTFYHGGGFEPFSNFEWELKMGDWIDLTKIPQEHLYKTNNSV